MKDVIIEKIKTLCVSYEIIHGRVVENIKRSQKQTTEIFVAIAAFFAFAAAVVNIENNGSMMLMGRYILIYLIPLLSFSAIISILSIEIRQIYFGIYLSNIEKEINECFEALTFKNEGVLWYEYYRLYGGHRKNQATNFDFYILGIATFIIGIGPAILLLHKNSSNIEVLIFLIEIIALIMFLVITIVKFIKENNRLKRIVMEGTSKKDICK